MEIRYKTVLIDGDNTLMDFDAAERQALRRTMEARGLAFTPERLGMYIKINRELWDAAHRGEIDRDYITGRRFRLFGDALDWHGDAEAWDEEYLDALGDCRELLPGAMELLQALKPHCRIGLTTNGLQKVQRKRLRDNPMAAYLDGVFISQEMGVGKPRKAYFDQVLAALGGDPTQTVVVGDDLLSDIQGAVNAGLDSIWFAPRGGDSPLPTWKVGRLEEVAAIVLGQN